MRASHTAGVVDVAFDEPNLIADAGLVPVVALAEQISLPDLVAEQVAITGAANSAGANPAAKVMSLLAGMIAGADSITDADRLRHAGNRRVFDQIRAPQPWARSCGRSPMGMCSNSTRYSAQRWLTEMILERACPVRRRRANPV